MACALDFASLTRCDAHGANVLPHLASALLCQNAFVVGSAYAGGSQGLTRTLGQRAQLFESASSPRSPGSAKRSNSLGIITVTGQIVFSSCAVLLGLSRNGDYALTNAQPGVAVPRHCTYKSVGAGSIRRNVRTGLALDTQDGLPTCLYATLLFSALCRPRWLGMHIPGSPNLVSMP
jgi:hypothetical protein